MRQWFVGASCAAAWIGLVVGTAAIVVAENQSKEDRAGALRAIEPSVLSRPGDDEARRKVRGMVFDDLRARRLEANRADREAWRAVRTKADWERLRDERITALRRSLGRAVVEKSNLNLRSLKTIEGDGFRIENVVFQSRPGLVVTANLYSPAEPAASMPGILICHSHHRPKIDGELQDMGMTFARAGCVVLVMDQLGHGERRQHPFVTEKDFNGSFRPSRQDYHFRYNVGMQLHLVGESLVGWMAHDMSRGVDALLARQGVDPKRIILLGAVAGGGDPSAVAAALDPRIAVVAPFNFGGPQPENIFPLPEDAEESFNMFGGGSWESTRNLKGSIGHGFPPWIIVASVAPRGLIYAHEFAWDRERDPVWKRLQRVFELEGSDRLSFTHGYGKVTLSSAEASHCNHIGPTHLKLIYPSLEKWFGIPVPKTEYKQRRDAAELLCLSSPGGNEILMPPLHALLTQLADERGEAFRRGAEGPANVDRADSDRADAASRLRAGWKERLGDVEPRKDATSTVVKGDGDAADALKSIATIERFVVRTERAIDVPALLLKPVAAKSERGALVVCVAQGGKAGFLKHRAERIAELLAGGAAVCLVDVRGTGETSVGNDRGRRSDATSASSSELMHGGTFVGGQLKDLRTVLATLRKRSDVDPARIALWGDSFAPHTAHDVRAPLDAEKLPTPSEPIGHLLALLGGLLEPEVAAVASARGGLVSFASLLDSPFPNIPHDTVIPGCLELGDLDDVAAEIVPRPLWIGGLVDGQNRPAEKPGEEGQKSLLPRTTTKAAARREVGAVVVRPDDAPDAELTKWLLARLTPKR